MGPAEPDEEKALERSGPHESLEHPVTVGLSFEADRDVARANAWGHFPVGAREGRSRPFESWITIPPGGR